MRVDYCAVGGRIGLSSARRLVGGESSVSPSCFVKSGAACDVLSLFFIVSFQYAVLWQRIVFNVKVYFYRVPATTMEHQQYSGGGRS